jgi:hypothetical protein
VHFIPDGAAPALVGGLRDSEIALFKVALFL